MRRRTTKPTSTTPALRRLGLATPPPFVGRQRELAALGEALSAGSPLVVRGAVGSGKTRLARQLALSEHVIGYRVAHIRCEPGDVGIAVRARAERALAALPGSLPSLLTTAEVLLVLDDVHHLAEEDIARTLAGLVAEDEASGRGRLLLLTRDALPIRRDVGRFELDLEGLDEAAARELWHHLEETYGPTAAGACDDALAFTRGMPLALRREYARSLFGTDAWLTSALPRSTRRALEAVAVLRVPAAPAALAALISHDETEQALIDLVSRQLVDPLQDGRFSIHDVVRDDVLECMEEQSRRVLERAAAELVATAGRGLPQSRRVAWDAGDDGALGHLDPVDRLREAVLHLLAAGDPAAALARLQDGESVALLRGASGELIAIIDAIARVADASLQAPLRAARARIALRQGRVAEALELASDANVLSAAQRAWLQYCSGQIAGARSELERELSSDEPATRCQAAALLVELELASGNRARAEALVTTALERDRNALDDTGRARLHLAMTAVLEHAGQVSAARAALARIGGQLDAGLAARVAARRAVCLAREGRLAEADTALADAEQQALEVDEAWVAEELIAARAMLLARRGALLEAEATLRALVSARRERGDEVGALVVELELAAVLLRRGVLAAACELAAACSASAARRGLAELAARARLIAATIDARELRLAEARHELEALIASQASAAVRSAAELALAEVNAWAGEGVGQAPLDEELRDAIDLGSARAAAHLAAGDGSAAAAMARSVAVRAERSGRAAELADALALAARLQLARGDKDGAVAAATRAAREASSCGMEQARVTALLVLAAVARDEGAVTVASDYARDAARIAVAAGLPVERLVAAEALEAIADAGDASAAEARNAAAATMSQAALDAAGRLLSDLGLTAARPYRLVSATGTDSLVADANPDLLRMGDRNLAVDGIREVIVRDGAQIADLRRRSLLKRLLFLFAGAPGRVFSKEEIVQTVWDVEYHPLRHDAALFTNIMRIRRLLGSDGADLIRVNEEGYRFVPPKDFLFVEIARAAS